MATAWIRGLQKAAVATAVAAAVAGCSTFETERAVADKAQSLRKGPASAPQQTITNFSSALRCMDGLFASYGVRDVGVLVEDLTDHTKKVNAGSKDMLISAISQMTIRSKAVKLVIYGQDSGNLIGLLRESQRRHAYANLPEFDIKGSISQLDENLVRKQADAGFSFSDKFSIGASKTASASVLAVDLSMLSTSDLSVVPGVTSRNSVVIFKSGAGADSEAQIKKFGMNFNLSIAQAEGQTQALRTLLELAAIELLGKLTRVPYWTCLGSNAGDEAVKIEISDWFSSMLADSSELVRYFQNQLRVRGVYRGAVDGRPTPELADAVAAYRVRLGLKKNYQVDLEFFTAYLNARHAAPVAFIVPGARAVPAAATADAAAAAAPAPAGKGAPVAKAVPASGAPSVATARSAPAAPASVRAAPLAINVVSPSAGQVFRAGEAIAISVTPNRDAFVYCYLQDENRQIVRFFPNRFQADARVKGGATLSLPGAMRFQLVANKKGLDETVACFASERETLALLPRPLAAADFEPVNGASLNALKAAFRQAAGDAYAEGFFQVRVR